MAVANLTVNGGGGGGGWIAFADGFPACLNDGDNNTYMGCDGDYPGTVTCTWDHSPVPAGAAISAINVSGLWGAGSPTASANHTVWRAGSSISLGNIGDVSSFSTNVPRPGGGSWTKDDLGSMSIVWTNNQTGSGNTMRFKSVSLSVTYEFPPAGFLLIMGSLLLGVAARLADVFLGRA